MILVTGGLGFIGSHTLRALLDLGETCIATTHHRTAVPVFLEEEVGRRLQLAPLDISDQDAYLALGRGRNITAIVHLAANPLGSAVFEELRVNLAGLANTLQAAEAWGVKRVCIASSIGVYAGVDAPLWQEDCALPMLGALPVETYKKCFELLSTYVARKVGFEVASMRLSAIWGPLGRQESMFFAMPRMVHAAVRGEPTDFTPPARREAFADDEIDLCYVKDCARAIALLATAKDLRHHTYNVGGGMSVSNAEAAQAIRLVVPGAAIDFTPGKREGGHRFAPLDTRRLREDTAFEPLYGLAGGVADYADWLRSGNSR